MQPFGNFLIRAISCLCLCLSLSSYCLSDDHIINIAADPWCPYNCASDAQDQGIMIDIAREAFALSGYTLNYQTLNWARAKALVRAGKLDGIVGMALSKNSKSLYHFPSLPLGQSQICLFTRAEDSWHYQSTSSLEGKVFGWINDYGFAADPLDSWIEKTKTVNT